MALTAATQASISLTAKREARHQISPNNACAAMSAMIFGFIVQSHLQKFIDLYVAV